MVTLPMTLGMGLTHSKRDHISNVFNLLLPLPLGLFIPQDSGMFSKCNEMEVHYAYFLKLIDVTLRHAILHLNET